MVEIKRKANIMNGGNKKKDQYNKHKWCKQSTTSTGSFFICSGLSLSALAIQQIH